MQQNKDGTEMDDEDEEHDFENADMREQSKARDNNDNAESEDDNYVVEDAEMADDYDGSNDD